MGRLIFSESNLQGVTAYGWDKAGNRRYVHRSEGIEWSDFNGLNQLTTKRAPAGTVTYSYDRNGNKVREQGPGFAREFSYNVCNRLVEVRAGATTGSLATINTNTFRGDGQRISKTELGRTVNYTYQDGAVLYTTGTNNQLINFHLKAPEGALISMLHAQNRGNIASNFTTDIRRSTSTVLCDKGQFFSGFRYSDFGETTRLVDTYEHIEIAYTGGIWDQSTGLYYLNARFYNPVDARFLTMDVARNGGDLRATLSLYGYCEGDPINKVDPSGYRSQRFFPTLGRDQTTYLRRVLRVNAGWAMSQRVRHMERPRPGSGGWRVALSPSYQSWFQRQVTHRAPWDFKIAAPSALRTSRDLRRGGMRFNGQAISLEDFGNIHYGFVGRAAGFSLGVLRSGSVVAAGSSIARPSGLRNELGDQRLIRKGYDLQRLRSLSPIIGGAGQVTRFEIDPTRYSVNALGRAWTQRRK